MSPLKHNGVLLMLIATGLLSTMAALMKFAALSLPLFEVIFFRNFATAAAVGFIMGRRHVSFRGINKIGLATRSLLGFSAMSLGVFAMTRIPLAQASLLGQTAPLFIVLLSWAFLREPITVRLWVWIVIGLVGVGFVLHPGFGGFSIGNLAALGSGFLGGAVFTSLRYLGASDDSRRIVFHFSAWGTVLAAPWCFGHWVAPSWLEWGVLSGIGVVGTLGQLFLTQAYRVERASVIGGLHYLSVLFAALYGRLFWGESLTWTMVAGGMLIVACGLAVGTASRYQTAQSLGS